MEKDIQAIKHKLVVHYDDDATTYREANYGGENDYLPLEFRQHYIEQMIEELAVPEGARILDVGCGPGELVFALTRKGYEVWGVDISEGMIGEARQLLEHQGVDATERLGLGDIENLSFENGFFDVVVASGVIEYQKDDHAAMSEMARVLTLGGHLLLNVTNRYAYLNWIDEPYRWLKKKRATRAAMNFLKETVFGRGALNDLPDRRTHVPGAFDRTMVEHGFTKRSENYFGFSPLPTPLDSVFRGFCRTLGKRMEGLTNHPLGRVLAGGYLVSATKER